YALAFAEYPTSGGNACSGSAGGGRFAGGTDERIKDTGRVLQAAEWTACGPFAGPHSADGLRCGVLPHRISRGTERPNRFRSLVRTHDVPGLAEPRQNGVHQTGATERRNLERLHAL